MSANHATRPLFARVIRKLWPLVIVGWVVLIALANVTAPQLDVVGKERAVSLSPSEAPSLEAARRIGKAFKESNSDSSVMILVESDKPFTPDDAARQYYDNVVSLLRKDPGHIQNIRDFWSDPLMADGAQSTDNKAAFVQVTLAGNQGEALANESVQAVRTVLDTVKKPDYVHSYMAGGAALAADMNIVGDESAKKVDIATALVLLVILLITYRSLWVLGLLFLIIAFTLSAAKGAVANLGHYGFIGLSTTTTAMISALTVAVGTDYAIFLIGRYQTARKAGESREDSYYTTIRSIAHVILGSGLTVAGSIYCLSFARLPAFQTIAAPCAVAVLVAIASSLTIGPAILIVGGRFGFFDPKKKTLEARGWRRVGTVVARWPVPVLTASCAVAFVGLLALANYQPSYDDRSFIPQNTPANKALLVADEHFSISRMSPETLMIETGHDMRTPTDMLVLEKIAKAVYHLPGIARLQGITRPSGTTPLAHTSMPYAMDTGNSTIENMSYKKARLADMKKTLESMEEQLRTMKMMYGLQKEMSGISHSMAYEDVPEQLKTLKDTEEKSSVIEDYMRMARNIFYWIGSDCYDWSWCWAARNTMDMSDSVSTSIDQMEVTLDKTQQIDTLTQRMLSTTPRMIQLMEESRKIAQMQYSNQLGDMRQQELSLENAGVMGKAFDASHNDDSFYIGPDTIASKDFKKALKTFLSPDGKSARFFATYEESPTSPEGMALVPRILSTAHEAMKGTPLEGSKIVITGSASMVKDMRDGATFDLLIAIVSSLSLILVIMLILMRSLIAAIVIVGTVALSLGASFGMSVLLWQDILGKPLHWSVLVVSVIIMLAVGADYNLLFVARLKEEMPAGLKTGIIRTMGATGSMETAAGLVFALTLGSLVVSDLRTTAQLGSTICLGILFDTFIVRAFMTPAVAAILGRWFWWPQNVRSRPLRHKAETV